MKFTVTVELEHASGPEQDVETMLDCFAGTIGQQNAARHPLHLTTSDGETESVYFVKLIDDARVSEPLRNLDIQAREHGAWIEWATAMRDIGFDLNTVNVVDFEPARVALAKWALVFAEGHEAGVFTTLKAPE